MAKDENVENIVERVSKLSENEAKNLLIEIFSTVSNGEHRRSREEVLHHISTIYSRTVFGIDITE